MKTLVVLFGILFCIAISNANAQSESIKESWPIQLGYQCDEVWDFVTGTGNFHYVTKTDKDGKILWVKMQMHSIELVSAATEEEFRWNFIQKQDAWGMPGSIMEFHYNLIGNLGTHILVSVVVDISGGFKIVEQNVKCL